MQRTWVRAGFDPVSFWDLTPREINNILSGVQERARQDYNDSMTLAWHTASLVRADRMPALDRLLIRDQPRRMSWQEMLNVVKGINAMYQNKEKR